MNKLEKLYKGLEVIKVQFIGKTHPYHIYLNKEEFDAKSMEYKDTVDCRVCSWADNVWFRTPKGVRYEKYSSVAKLKQAIAFAGKSRGLIVESFIIQAPKV